MAEHVRMLHRLDATPVATELFHHPDLGSSDLVVVTRDLPGLFSLIAGTLAAHGVNIISAQIATRADGIAIDTFQVNDPDRRGDHRAGPVGARARRAAGRRGGRAERRRAAGPPPRRARPAAAAPAPPRISIDNSLSDEYTVVEVKCPDRLGLLYLITRTLSSLGCDIVSARIATEIDQAFDTFYVHDGQGRQGRSPRGARAAARGAGARPGPAPVTAPPRAC